VNNRERSCTFCTIKNEANLPDETFVHLFLECKYTRSWHSFFVNKFLPEFAPVGENDKKKLWFLGILPSQNKANLFVVVSILCFQHRIWEAKLSKKIPSGTTLEIKFTEVINSFIRRSKLARTELGKISNLSLCRNFGYGYVGAVPAALAPAVVGDAGVGPQALPPLPGPVIVAP